MQGRAVNLLYRLFLRNSTKAHQIPYIPSKTVISPLSEGSLTLAAPEEVGLDSAYIEKFLSALEGERAAALHSIGIARDGKVICLASAPGFGHDIRHQTHSLCKTVTGLCVGILVGEGRLDIDTPITRIITEGVPSLLSSRTKAITVRHLLSMTAGVIFAEVGSVTMENWIRAYLSSSVAFPPGSRFAYNSMNSYMLSVIVEKITGKTLLEFAQERIFTPLGIGDVFWESCPLGHTKGGWGLYLSVADSLKLGQMILDGGTFEGRRVVPREWIRQMSRCHAKTPEATGAYHYGFHMWVARDGKSMLCNGMLGQNIWICPQNRLVLVTTASNCELFQNGPMFPLIHEYFSERLPKEPKRSNRRALRSLREHEERFFDGRTWTRPTEPHSPLGDGHVPAELWARLARAPFLAERNNFGILPLFVMLTQNNLSAGIVSLSFSRRGEEYFLTLAEGSETYRIRVGFLAYRESVLSVRDEKFLVRARAEFCDDTNGIPILKIELLFPELASSRRLCLYYKEEKPTVVLSEQPGRRMLDYLIDLFDFMPRTKLLGSLLRSQMEREMIAYRVRTCYEPTLRLGRGEAPVEIEFPHFDGTDHDRFDASGIFAAEVEGKDAPEKSPLSKAKTAISKSEKKQKRSTATKKAAEKKATAPKSTDEKAAAPSTAKKSAAPSPAKKSATKKSVAPSIAEKSTAPSAIPKSTGKDPGTAAPRQTAAKTKTPEKKKK